MLSKIKKLVSIFTLSVLLSLNLAQTTMALSFSSVDTGLSVIFADMEIDSSGNIHAAALNPSVSEIYYYKYDGSWTNVATVTNSTINNIDGIYLELDNQSPPDVGFAWIDKGVQFGDEYHEMWYASYDTSGASMGSAVMVDSGVDATVDGYIEDMHEKGFRLLYTNTNDPFVLLCGTVGGDINSTNSSDGVSGLFKYTWNVGSFNAASQVDTGNTGDNCFTLSAVSSGSNFYVVSRGSGNPGASDIHYHTSNNSGSTWSNSFEIASLANNTSSEAISLTIDSNSDPRFITLENTDLAYFVYESATWTQKADVVSGLSVTGSHEGWGSLHSDGDTEYAVYVDGSDETIRVSENTAADDNTWTAASSAVLDVDTGAGYEEARSRSDFNTATSKFTLLPQGLDYQGVQPIISKLATQDSETGGAVPEFSDYLLIFTVMISAAMIYESYKRLELSKNPQ